MSQRLTVRIPHQLGKAGARRRIEHGLGEIRGEFQQNALNVSFDERWEEDRIDFSAGRFGQQICGRLAVEEDAVQVEMEMPRLLAALAGRLKQRIADRGRALLAEPDR